MEKAVLLGVEGESRKIIEEADCGLFFEPENSDDLASKIMNYKNDLNLMLKHGRNGKRYVKENFNREKLAERYLNLILSFLDNN